MKAARSDISLGSDGLAPLTTAELAKGFGVEAQTVRSGLCRDGHYLGIRPLVKLPNGRLLFDAAQQKKILAGEVLS